MGEDRIEVIELMQCCGWLAKWRRIDRSDRRYYLTLYWQISMMNGLKHSVNIISTEWNCYSWTSFWCQGSSRGAVAGRTRPRWMELERPFIIHLLSVTIFILPSPNSLPRQTCGASTRRVHVKGRTSIMYEIRIIISRNGECCYYSWASPSSPSI